MKFDHITSAFAHRRVLIATFTTVAVVAAGLSLDGHAAAAEGNAAKPTIVLVHGAFAESSSWNGVAASLIAMGYPVLAVANPLRGLKSDSDYVASTLRGITGPMVLVGHSYGGSVITNAGHGQANVKALVYVAAFAPDAGETAADFGARFPGGTLAPTLASPVPLPEGGNDLYIRQDKFRSQFAADIAPREAALMAATQRPVRDAVFGEASGLPAWKTVPSWFVYGTADKNIPRDALSYMATRAGSRKTIEIPGASHVVMTSHPATVTRLIVEAATVR